MEHARALRVLCACFAPASRAKHRRGVSRQPPWRRTRAHDCKACSVCGPGSGAAARSRPGAPSRHRCCARASPAGSCSPKCVHVSRRSRGDRSNGECAPSHGLRAASVRNELGQVGRAVLPNDNTVVQPVVRRACACCRTAAKAAHSHIMVRPQFATFVIQLGNLSTVTFHHPRCTNVIGAQPHPLHCTGATIDVARFGAPLRLQQHGRHAVRGPNPRTSRTRRRQARRATPRASTVITSCTSSLKDSLSCHRSPSVRPASRPPS